MDYPLDRATAEQALRENLVERVGPSELDPFIQQAFDELNRSENNHVNKIIYDNCKTETKRLIRRADKKLQDWMSPAVEPSIYAPYILTF
jgi:hypothetical protein